MTAAGIYNEKTGMITIYDEDEDPLMGVRQKFGRNLKIVSPDQYYTGVVFKEFRTPEEKEFKMVEITHTRKGSSAADQPASSG